MEMQLGKIGVKSHSLKVKDVHEQPNKVRNKTVLSDHQEKGTPHEEIISKDKVETVVSQLNGFIEPIRTNLQFKLHEELNEYYVTVVNPLTNEIIREIPPKKML